MNQKPLTILSAVYIAPILTRAQENAIFKEAVNGYGFEEVEQSPDGVYCTGCLRIHKRPTKMYTNGRDTLCKYQIVRLYNPDDTN